jgi:hypothetical protein
MRSHVILLLECLVSFGIPLGWAVRELFILRRRPPRDPGHAAPPLPLPPSLFPEPPPSRVRSRVLEDA